VAEKLDSATDSDNPARLRRQSTSIVNIESNQDKSRICNDNVEP
jgi:hypothetical protein